MHSFKIFFVCVYMLFFIFPLVYQIHACCNPSHINKNANNQEKFLKLPCNHTICEACCRQLAGLSGGKIDAKKFSCPHCKKIVNPQDIEDMLGLKPARNQPNLKLLCSFKTHRNNLNQEAVYTILDCNHTVCTPCCDSILIECMTSRKTVQINCPICNKVASKKNLRSIIGEERWQEYICFFEGFEESNCTKCNKIASENFIILDCSHIYHKNCLQSEILQYFKKNKNILYPCLKCSKLISQNIQKLILGELKYNEIEESIMKDYLSLGHQATCCKCGKHQIIKKGKIEELQSDIKLKLKPDQLECYLTYRFTCSACKITQCGQCKKEPYHDFYTCAEYTKKQNSMQFLLITIYLNQFIQLQKCRNCRYCDTVIEVIDNTKQKAFQDICNSEDCSIKLQYASNLILPCGHPNCGVRNDTVKCLYLKNDKTPCDPSVDSNDYCNICYIESIKSAPCIQLKCGHIFHYACVKKKLDVKWTTASINFAYLLCSLCHQLIEVNEKNELYSTLKKEIEFKKTFETKILDRLVKEGHNKDQKMVSGEFKGKDLEYAMKIYRYHLCFKCKNPFFAGLKECAQNEEENANKEEFICYQCAYQGLGKITCNIHGNDFINFKCKFCCSLAVWFCFGTTHFCEPCHRIPGQVMATPIQNLPKCNGINECPLKINHPPNGNECPLGCSLCSDEALQKNGYQQSQIKIVKTEKQKDQTDY